ncbi:MAG: cytidylyltransferase domain-containing protein [Cetobacterium sp.]
MKKSLGIFMPARLTSERLPKKHLLPLNDEGLTMWEIACDRLSKVKNAEKYVLISELDKELVAIAEKYNLNILLRELETTLADAPLNFVFKDIEKIKESHVMFLNPCVLTLEHETITKAVDKFLKSDKDYGTSVINFRNWVLDENANSLLDEIDFTKISTKNIPIRNQFAHCFHVFNKENFFIDGMMLKEGFEMMEVKESDVLLDLDTKEDYEAACKFFRKTVKK